MNQKRISIGQCIIALREIHRLSNDLSATMSYGCYSHLAKLAEDLIKYQKGLDELNHDDEILVQEHVESDSEYTGVWLRESDLVTIQNAPMHTFNALKPFVDAPPKP